MLCERPIIKIGRVHKSMRHLLDYFEREREREGLRKGDRQVKNKNKKNEERKKKGKKSKKEFEMTNGCDLSFEKPITNELQY